MRTIRAGALRTAVFLGRPAIAQDAAGAQAITWEEVGTWAQIEPLTGREWANNVAVKDAVDCRITLRIIPGWKPTARWRVREKESGAIYELMTAMLLPSLGMAECLGKTAVGTSDGR